MNPKSKKITIISGTILTIGIVVGLAVLGNNGPLFKGCLTNCTGIDPDTTPRPVKNVILTSSNGFAGGTTTIHLHFGTHPHAIHYDTQQPDGNYYRNIESIAKIKFIFPSGYDAGNGNILNCHLGGKLLSYAEFLPAQVTFRYLPSVHSYATMDCNLINITNPKNAGETGNFYIQTFETEDDSTLLDWWEIDPLKIIAAPLPPPPAPPVDKVLPQSLVGETTNKVDVSLMGGGMYISTDSHIVLIFPSEFDLAGVTSASCGFEVGGNLNGGFTYAKFGQSVTITRTGSTPTSTASGDLSVPIHCVIDGVRNIYTGATTGNFGIAVYNEDYTRTEYENTRVSGVTISSPAIKSVVPIMINKSSFIKRR